MPSRSRIVEQPNIIHEQETFAEHNIAGQGPAGDWQRQEQKWHVLDMMLSSFADFAYAFDHDGRFLYANQPLLSLWGLRLEDVIGKNFLAINGSPHPATQVNISKG